MTAIWMGIAILTSSFLGSWHCAAMCSPVASLMAQRKSLLSYHLGRGLSYAVLGLIGGTLGQVFLESEFIWLRWVGATLFASTLIGIGISLLFPRHRLLSSHFLSQKLALLFQRINVFKSTNSGFMIGILTALLPCGWLYTYVLAAVATKSPWAGALTMSIFWLGTLPALSALPLMIKKAIGGASLRQQKIAGGILIVAGLYSLVSFFAFHHI